MKVYVVSYGSYSDWSIKGLFLDKEKAEQYNALVQGHNDVEEYDTMDDNLITPVHYITCRYETKDVPMEGYPGRMYKTKGKFEFEVETTNSLDAYQWILHSTSYWRDQLTVHRQINKLPCNDIEYEDLKSKYHKICTDFAALIENELANGVTDDQINKMLAGE